MPSCSHVLQYGSLTKQALVRQEACAAGAARLGLPELLVVGKGYEGQAPTARMLAGEQTGLQHVHACCAQPRPLGFAVPHCLALASVA